MKKLWRWLIRTGPSPETRHAQERLARVQRDDIAIDRLTRAIRRTRTENNLGTQVSRALRTRRS